MTPPVELPTPPAPPEPPSRPSRSIALGFAVGALVWLSPLIFSAMPRTPRREGPYIEIELLIFASLMLPPFSALLAAIRPTRRFGLGLLLACGIGWLILGAMCGGAFR